MNLQAFFGRRADERFVCTKQKSIQKSTGILKNELECKKIETLSLGFIHSLPNC